MLSQVLIKNMQLKLSLLCLIPAYIAFGMKPDKAPTIIWNESPESYIFPITITNESTISHTSKIAGKKIVILPEDKLSARFLKSPAPSMQPQQQIEIDDKNITQLLLNEINNPFKRKVGRQYIYHVIIKSDAKIVIQTVDTCPGS